jgi:hypothetical protein
MPKYEVIGNRKHPQSDVYHHMPIGTIVETDCQLDFFGGYECYEVDGGWMSQSILPRDLKEI